MNSSKTRAGGYRIRGKLGTLPPGREAQYALHQTGTQVGQESWTIRSAEPRSLSICSLLPLCCDLLRLPLSCPVLSSVFLSVSSLGLQSRPWSRSGPSPLVLFCPPLGVSRLVLSVIAMILPNFIDLGPEGRLKSQSDTFGVYKGASRPQK